MRALVFSFKLSLRDLVEMMAERGLLWPIRLLCAGCGDTYRNSRSAGSGLRQAAAAHGGWTRRTSRFEADGSISIGRWIGVATPLTSG